MISGGCNIWDIWDLPYLVQEDICYVRGGVEEEGPPVLSLQFSLTLVKISRCDEIIRKARYLLQEVREDICYIRGGGGGTSSPLYTVQLNTGLYFW